MVTGGALSRERIDGEVLHVCVVCKAGVQITEDKSSMVRFEGSTTIYLLHSIYVTT